jgi:hypothetical protein
MRIYQNMMKVCYMAIQTIFSYNEGNLICLIKI